MSRNPLSAVRLSVAMLLAASCWQVALHAQCLDGRIFQATPETLGIWEMNDLPVQPGEFIPDGTAIPDLSGNGLDAVVRGNTNTIVAATGDPNFDTVDVANTAAGKVNGAGPPRITVENDGDAFEMDETEDFTVELYVRREAVAGAEGWGILAGTWHSRTLIDDAADVNTESAWYGWGFIRRGGQEGWLWVCSPVNPDGSLRGTGCCNEVRNDASWVITEGSHYIVASVDRTLNTVEVYLDGDPIEQILLGPDDSFITPTDYEHANFTMLTGVDDLTRNAFRTAPSGYHIDAARVQKRALTADEIFDNYILITDGVAVPDEGGGQAVLTASSRGVLVDQCVRLSAEASCVGDGVTIDTYEWKIGDGDFVVGEAVFETTFAVPSGPGGVDVTVRITDSGGGTAEASTNILVSAPAVTASLAILADGVSVAGDPVSVPIGASVTLDASGSVSIIPGGAFECPLDAQIPLAAPDVTDYEWTIDGAANSGPSVDLGVLDTLREFDVSLTVRNASGSEDTVSATILVADSGGNSQVFQSSDDTVLHVEFNELEPGVIPGVGDIAAVPDLSVNEKTLTVVGLDEGNFEAVGGAAHFTDNGALTYVGGGPSGRNGPRGEIRDDEQLYEMGPTDDFTFEIYFRPGANLQPQWGDVAGTFKARTDGLDTSPRYGWGIIKSHLDTENPGYAWFTPNQSPEEVPVFFNAQADAFSYVACVVNRVEGSSSVYVNGQLASQRLDIDPAWSFETPDGFPHAPFYTFTREQQDLAFSNCPDGVTIDALRLQRVALTEEDVIANWEAIRSGQAAGPPPTVVVDRPVFNRMDPNGDGVVNITDGVFILSWLFRGGDDPVCMESADCDNDGMIALTDGIFVFNYLFLSIGRPPPPPGGVDTPCGPDTDEEGSPDDLGCAEYAGCAAE